MAEGQFLLQAIASVGFPIVAFFMMFWLINKTLKELITEIRELIKGIREIESALNSHSPPRIP